MADAEIKHMESRRIAAPVLAEREFHQQRLVVEPFRRTGEKSCEQFADRSGVGGDFDDLFAAAMLTVSDSRGMNPLKTLGWLSGRETGPIVTMLNGFLEGARLIDPEIRIVHRSLDSFEDAQLARERCREILAEGADIVVLAAGSAGLAALDELAGRQALAIGLAADQDGLRPGQVLTSILKQGDRAVYEIVASHVQGKFRGGEILTYSLSDGGVGITDFRRFAQGDGNRMPPRLAGRLAELRRELERQAIRLPSLRQGTLCNCR